ncbi:small proline-rich protein 2B [Cajanus cajan]|uniref:small proline-rich protein 2B n=1 Tax=Cajanus cajan TaxID=3821 RepID=UPI00098D9108|nr:small proline-rich protein 2B [Cajanus cajan]
MATSLPLVSSFFILFLAYTVSAINNTEATSTVTKDIVPCTMCDECDNPCQPLPSPPPPVVECPPPPPPPPLPVVVECPPPPKTSCEDCEIPQGPPRPVLYFPPGTPNPYYVKNNGEKMKPFQAMWHVFLFLVAYLFI